MAQYQVSARKYRPALFDEVVGQRHITATLENAIKNEQIAQAFLFCGPRGVGKTTCARILAKAINMPDPIKSLEDGSYADTDLDVSLNIFELDAASNNSVDDIRNLIEKVRYAPQSGRYKVYIIDEVHMLSAQAFNAFLKTLEEPPPYAIFILATTEKHKILPTILSRCQIFNFKRIGIKDMVSHLRSICEKENLEIDDDSLHLIAQKADGALRDSLSIFDRISGFSNGKIAYDEVLEILNELDHDYFFRLTDSIMVGDSSQALLLLDEIIKKGFDGSEFLEGLARHFRNLLLAKEERTSNILELSDQVHQRYLKQSQLISGSFVLNALNIVNQYALNFKTSKNKRLQLELAILKLVHTEHLLNLDPQNQIQSQKKNDSVNESAQVLASTPQIEAKSPPQIKQEVNQEGNQEVSQEVKTETPAESQTERKVESNKVSPPKIDLSRKEKSIDLKATSIALPSIKDLEKSAIKTVSEEAKTEIKQDLTKSTLDEEKKVEIKLEIDQAKTEQKTEPSVPLTKPNLETVNETILPSLEKEIETKTTNQENITEPDSTEENQKNEINLQVENPAPLGGGINLSSLTDLYKEEEEKLKTEEGRRRVVETDLSTDYIQTHWKIFTDGLSSGQSKAIFRKYPPVLNANKISVKVSNPIEEARLRDESMEFIGLLTKQFNLLDLELDVQIDKSLNTQEVKRVFTTEDKFKVLIEKNPAIGELQKRLYLELKN